MGTEELYEVSGGLKVYGGLIDEITKLPVWINEKTNKATVYILNDNYEGQFGDYYEIPSKITINSEDLNAVPKEFNVSTIVIKCPKWRLSIPESIEEVIIDREDYNKSGNSENSLFSVPEDSQHFKSEKGSLYSKDGKVLYHYHSSEESELLEELEEIRPGAIYKPGTRYNLVIPPKCNNIAKGAISGEFSSIDFTGGLNTIENGALENIDCDEFSVNGLLSQINVEGQEGLKEWYNAKYKKYACNRKHKLFFADFHPSVGKVIGNGYIELTKVLSIEEKLKYKKDTNPICINSYINERFEDLESCGVPIVVESVVLDRDDDNCPYSQIDATCISFVCKTSRETILKIYVHEPFERVMELINKSFEK